MPGDATPCGYEMRFHLAKDIANFGLISPDPIEQHVFRHVGTRGYGAARSTPVRNNSVEKSAA
jgi:hypothetical protein